ncbi:MAG TPA: hypothetical protein VKR42_13245 [Ktedonobacteraceae bacterium]|nr:hypothetical protein [Ktedonobacteraceae bacterium]
MRIWTRRLDDENEPAYWHNEHSHECPVIDDFEVILEKIVGPGPEEPGLVEGPELDEELVNGEPIKEHYWVYFFSQKLGYIMGPSPWIEEELCRNDFAVPLNYWETDQGGDLIIYTHREFVIIEEGIYKKPENLVTPWFQVPWVKIPLGKVLKACQFPVMHAWRSYKVPKDHYIEEWNLAIEASKHLS